MGLAQREPSYAWLTISTPSERKKHIGNDIVVIIYQEEGSQPFDPRWVKSWFNHVFVIVRSVSSQPRQYQYVCLVLDRPFGN